MKRFFTIAAALCICLGAISAQDKRNNDNRRQDDWKEKIKSEKVAFLTNEMNLTADEAQAFWPVYDKCYIAKEKAQRNVMKAYKALGLAVKENKDTGARLDEYIGSLESQEGLNAEHAAQFKAVLPVEKVAKLYLAEEKFRREQLHRLHNGGENRPGPARPAQPRRK